MLKNDNNNSHIIDFTVYTNITLPSCTKLDPTLPEEIEIKINSANFPDEAFRNYVKDNYDSDNSNGLSENEIHDVTFINISGGYSDYGTISDLTGIEFFTRLENLNCSGNQLTSLDVSNNTDLKVLACDYNELSALDFSSNAALTDLYCSFNQLTSLTFGDPDIIACDSNQLESLDFSKNTSLSVLSCSDNKLTSLDVTAYLLGCLPLKM